MSAAPPSAFVVHETECPVEGPEPERVQWRTLMSGDRTPSEALTLGVAELPPGAPAAPPHQHAQPEAYYVLAGEGSVEIDGAVHPLRPGSAVFLPGNARHVAWNTGDETLRILYVFPSDSFSEVQYRW